MYKLVKHDFHNYKIINTDTDECYGLFNRFEKCQLNNMIDKLNELEKELKPIVAICGKYNIPINDLLEVLEEYIRLDNFD